MDIVYDEKFKSLEEMFQKAGVVKEGNFTLPDGSSTNKFIDVRNAIINPEIMYEIGIRFRNLLFNNSVELLVPTSSAGLLLTVGLNTAMYIADRTVNPNTESKYTILPVKRDDVTIWPMIPNKLDLYGKTAYLLEAFGSRGTSIWARKVATALRNRGCRIAGMLILVAEKEEMESYHNRVAGNTIALCQVSE